MKKPYAFVPINPDVMRGPIIARDELKSDRYHGKLHLRIKALTPLLIATGELDLEGGQLVHGLTMRGTLPVIPGSSLKGMSRANAELMSKSCFMTKVPKVSGKKEFEVRQHLPDLNRNPCNGGADSAEKAKVCICCRMFGYVSMDRNKKNFVQKAAIEFSEFHLQGEPEQWVDTMKIPQLYAPMNKPQAWDSYLNDEDLLQKKVYRHGKPQTHEGVTYQVVKAGATFAGEVAFQNLSQHEVALFMLSLGASTEKRRFQAKLGYAKPAYFGSVQVDVEEVIPYSRPFLQEKLAKISLNEAQAWCEQYGLDDPFLVKQIDQVVEHYQFERDRGNEWGTNRFGKKGY